MGILKTSIVYILLPVLPNSRITQERMEELLNGIENNDIDIVAFVDKLT